jgi:hypothetical protein
MKYQKSHYSNKTVKVKVFKGKGNKDIILLYFIIIHLHILYI